ncbi:Flp pilus assembly protein CpaB [Evansella tamaricis]|uniref:Flp pilus assembly protein CpaB n=1 Tax=Evansella tamaricis TaxID=2069301 RepID=A0ABS6JLC5_9BACI|nr:Flp pilus assembly protein CpaB [Evansella tamaricis]MBU9714009.1 Flp pilus assembly protein CpaB [Evansella tamaricis]
MRSKMVFFMAIVMGVITTVLFYQYIQGAGQSQEVFVEEEMAEVVVAAEPIMGNQTITAEMLGKKEVTKASLHPNTIMEMDDVVGKFSTTLIESGEVLLSHRFKGEQEEKQFVSRKVQEGYRAVSLGADFIRSVSNLIEPEDYIDVIFTETIEEEVISEIILSKVRVLAVGRKMNPPSSEDSYIEYNSVTLELQPSDAAILVNASQRGSLHFMLHSSINMNLNGD